MLPPGSRRTPLLDSLPPLLTVAQPLCRQERAFTRRAVLTLGVLVALGRRSISQVLVCLEPATSPGRPGSERAGRSPPRTV